MRKFIPFIIFSVIVIILCIKIWPFIGDFFPTAARVVFHPGAILKEVNGKTNVLLLGIGGGSHDGPNLTDTIILASIDWKKNTATLISIPRDLWIPDLQTDSGVKKINEAYASDGLSLAEKAVSEVTGQQIQYGVRLDFQGFVDGLDQIGGVDVQVAHMLDDYNYPLSGKEDDTCGHTQQDIATFTSTPSATKETDNFDFFSCRYKHLHFDPGLTHMDGETALEFVRSRHGIGSEGSDFARSARQQLVIEAVRSKLISSAFLNPGKLLGLYGIIKSSIDTDMTSTDVGLFLDRLPNLKNAKVVTAVVDLGDYLSQRVGLLQLAPIDPLYDNLSVLIPRIGNGKFSEIQQFVVCEITKGNCTVSSTSVTPTP